MKFKNDKENRDLLLKLGYELQPSCDVSHHQISTYLMETIEEFRSDTGDKFSDIDAIEFNNALRDNYLRE